MAKHEKNKGFGKNKNEHVSKHGPANHGQNQPQKHEKAAKHEKPASHKSAREEEEAEKAREFNLTHRF